MRMNTASDQTSIHIVYVPGLGDSYDRLRRHALNRWKHPRCEVSFVPMNWQSRDETYEEKIKRLRTIIAASRAKKTVLIGESAGGSVVTAEFLSRDTDIDKAITICGKNVRADRVSPSIYVNNPAFRMAMQYADVAVGSSSTIEKGMFIAYQAWLDTVVFKVDMAVPGAVYRRLPSIGHFISIALMLYLFKNRIISEALKA